MIDLHCHTDCSDGSDAPVDVVRLATELGLEALAITDHDTLDGYDMARKQSDLAGCSLICGVELSTHSSRCSRSVHLLAYFFREPGSEFRSWLQELREGRCERNILLQQRLQSLGMEISWSELEAISGKQLGRPHFARLMVKKGYAASLQDAFDRYLAEGRPAYVERNEPALEEAVERVAAAGGIATLAHPARITRDPHTLRSLVADLIPYGLNAIECFHPEHSAEDTNHWLAIASELDLAVTGGSDYHGSYKPDIRLGTGRSGTLHVPSSLFLELKRRFAETVVNA
ncbi:PHP domain-containing protein [Silvibacterium acidisoli]|uniref:PHP domain-containing protein n=1 Tax=Acidobacteriaceae bacterium ZG23-2 TaxID=2883246 RepID=UPI00406C8B17